jgi:cytochrome c551/c552
MKQWITALLLACSFVLIAFALSQNNSGKAIFVNKKCNLCHSVSTQGIEAKTTSEKLKGPDLVNLANKHKPKWIGRYLKKKVKMNGKFHKRSFKGTDEELQTLVDWLLEQK